MGNAAFCAPIIISKGFIKVISSDGKFMIYANGPMKAAEIMLENPGQFLCEASQLKVGQRIVGLIAEEELERGQLYFLLPMEMLYSVLTNEEMKWLLTHKDSKRIKANISFSKIFPEFCLFQHSNSQSKELSAICSDTEGSNKRFSRQRSWQPALETIIETPPHS